MFYINEKRQYTPKPKSKLEHVLMYNNGTNSCGNPLSEALLMHVFERLKRVFAVEYYIFKCYFYSGY